MDAFKNVKRLEIFTILSTAGFIVPVLVPYYRDKMGLTFQDLMIGEVLFALTIVLLEMPSGWISDVWKRTHVLILGALFAFIGYGLLVIGTGFWWAIAAQITIGVSVSLISGTNIALLYDSLLSCGKEKDFRRLAGRRMAVGFYSISIASIAGGLLYSINIMLPILVQVSILAVAIAVACMMVEPERHKKEPLKNPFADIVVTLNYTLRNDINIGIILIFSSALFCATKLIMWIQQPYYIALEINEAWFGFLMAAGFVLAGFSSQLGYKLDGLFSNVKSLVLIWLVAIMVSLYCGLFVNWIGVALLIIGGSCLFGIGRPRVEDALNKRISSERRGTILSTQSLLISLAFIPAALIMGWLHEHHGIQAAQFGIAAWLGAAGVCLLLLNYKLVRTVHA